MSLPQTRQHTPNEVQLPSEDMWQQALTRWFAEWASTQYMALSHAFMRAAGYLSCCVQHLCSKERRWVCSAGHHTMTWWSLAPCIEKYKKNPMCIWGTGNLTYTICFFHIVYNAQRKKTRWDIALDLGDQIIPRSKLIIPPNNALLVTVCIILYWLWIRYAISVLQVCALPMWITFFAWCLP